MTRRAALPFTVKRSSDSFHADAIVSTKETAHGLLRLDGDRVIVQWRTMRKTDHMGSEMRTDREYEAVREVVVPLASVAGAAVRRRWWWFTGPRLVLTASDLRAFEQVAGGEGLRLGHPAELVLPVKRRDTLAAEEFAAEVVLAVAERTLARSQLERLGEGNREALGTGRPASAEPPDADGREDRTLPGTST